ncbi:ABC transporter permease [Petrocella sp. FN5]|uniref:ABC transporter permease n=1 Tax=Petrocella sp. FN5 TaxID=3032002 RepID=UPI0023DAA0C2|nr:ABC transporter permease [Petrocella sp. FN5]MDF1618653.1 ABC transporter permease [Petrocella sp. FN5]
MRMVKRTDMTSKKAAVIRILSIIFAFLLTSIFIGALGHNPMNVYLSMVEGAFGSAHRIRDTLTITIPLVVTSIGIMIAFKMKFWNIGAEGQIIVGALAASYLALNYNHLPKMVLLPAMFLAGFIGGGLWALIPAFFKVQFGTNETIFTLMMNYVALKWVTYLQYGPWKDPGSLGFPKIANFMDSAIMPKLFGVHIGWVIAIFLVIIIAIMMNYSKAGYEIAVVGESMDTAKYAGMNVKKVILSALFISGGIAGIVGMMQASAVNQTLSTQVAAGYGYTAIITAWLSGLKAVIIIPVSLLFAIMIKGGSFIQTAYQIPQSAAGILQSVILFFVIGSEFFIQYKLVRNSVMEKEVA